MNSRMAYVSVSRGQYDAQIYTNNRSELARDLSRDVSQSTAIGQEMDPSAQKIEPGAAQQEAQQPEHDQAHSIGHGIAT